MTIGLAATGGFVSAQPPAGSHLPPDENNCAICHGEAGLWEGETLRLHIAQESLADDAHLKNGVNCHDCHGGEPTSFDVPEAHSTKVGEDAEGVLPFRFPLGEVRKSCAKCHEDEGKRYADSVHGQALERGDELAPNCTECHGTHDIRGHADLNSSTNVMNIPELCGKCHHEGSPVSRTHDIPQDRILENYSLSIHGKGLFKQGLTVTAVCTSCHTSHDVLPHTDPRSSIHRDNVAVTCTQCHTRIEYVHRKVIEGHLWKTEPGRIPACADCHSPHKIRRVFYPEGMANKDCLKCHEDRQLSTERDGQQISLYVDEQAHLTGAHGVVACAQCHSEADPTHERPCETIKSKVDCGVCHAEEVELHRTSTHGQLVAKGDPDAPGCLDCHQKHATASKRLPTSPTFPRNIPALCARCHQPGESAAERIHGELEDLVGSYEMSIHGKGLLESGLVVTATCTSCHTAHHELPASDPDSSVHRDRINHTCGTCHHGIEEVFRDSVHWWENSDADRDNLPSCNDCHSPHTIGRTDTGDFRMMMLNQCGRCHEEHAETFFDTVHGKVSRLGHQKAAKCYDCHGTHEIKRMDDPDSLLGSRNIVATCAKCHPQAHRQFAGYLTHATHHDPKKYPYLFFAFWGMTALLVGTLSFFSLHTLAFLWRLVRTRKKWRHQEGDSVDDDGKFYLRFDRTLRISHAVLILSFFTLAITGMVLKFSYTGWACFVSDVLGGFGVTGVMHRLGAITLMGLFVFHALDVRKRKHASDKGWWEFLFSPDSIIPHPRDVKEFWATVKWFFGRGPKPHYERFTYWEKFDYFAVFWGIAIIGSTGLILWFPTFFTRFIPGGAINVAMIVHSDEGLLAVAFIFTIHFFNTHFRPDKFPMDTVMFTGRMSLSELKADRSDEYRRRTEEDALEHFLTQPIHPKVVPLSKAFGFLALLLGLTLIGLIIYAMIFGYQ